MPFADTELRWTTVGLESLSHAEKKSLRERMRVRVLECAHAGTVPFWRV